MKRLSWNKTENDSIIFSRQTTVGFSLFPKESGAKDLPYNTGRAKWLYPVSILRYEIRGNGISVHG